MNSLLRNKAIKLRIEKELSYSEIRRRLGVPKSTLSYWLKDYPLSKDKILELRRAGWSKGEASREQFRTSMRKIKEQKADLIYKSQLRKIGRLSDKSLYVAGLVLYLAEGAKKKESTIVLANTDPSVIKFFISWMNKFLDISREKVRIQLHLYEDMNIDEEVGFWLKSLELKKSQVYKPSIRKMRPSSFSYSESFRHGTCSLYAFGVEKRMTLIMAIKALVNNW